MRWSDDGGKLDTISWRVKGFARGWKVREFLESQAVPAVTTKNQAKLRLP